MGPKHPIALKLKKHNAWHSIIYKFKSLEMTNLIGKQKNIINSIYHYFQYAIISKPIFYYQNNILKIKIYYYVKPKKILAKNHTKFNSIRQPLWNQTQISKIEKYLSQAYNQNIEFHLIRLKNPIYNAHILAQLIAINLKIYSTGSIWRILLKKINKFNYSKKINFDKHLLYPNWMNIYYNTLFCKEFYSYVTGLKLKLSGRISKRRGASRAKNLSYSIGTLKFNSINSLIDYGHIQRKDKNGSQTIKLYIASSIGTNT